MHELVSAVRKQQVFMVKVLEQLHVLTVQHSSSPEEETAAKIFDIVQQYLCFLRSVGKARQSSQDTVAVAVGLEPPSTLVDLVWHVHQQCPERYSQDCQTLCGVFVDHKF